MLFRSKGRSDRLRPAAERLLRDHGERAAAAGRMLRSLGYQQTLARGFAVVRDAGGRVLPRAAEVARGAALDIQFHDGRVAAAAGRDAAGGAPPGGEPAEAPAATRAKPRSRARRHDARQGSLF